MIEKDGRFEFKAWCSGTSSDTEIVCHLEKQEGVPAPTHYNIGVTAESFLKANRQSAQKANDS